MTSVVELCFPDSGYDDRYILCLSSQTTIGCRHDPSCESADENARLATTGEQAQQNSFIIDENTAPPLASPEISPLRTQQTNKIYDQSTTHEITNLGTTSNSDSVTSLTGVTTTSPSGLEFELANNLTVPQETSGPLTSYASVQMFVIALACSVTFVGIGCVIGLLILKRLVGTYLDKTLVAWNILPQLGNRPLLVNVSDPAHCTEKEATDTEPKGNAPENLQGCLSHEKNMYIACNTILCEEPVTAQKQELDETFHDAAEVLNGFGGIDTVPDPDELPLPASLTPFSTPPSSPPRTPLRQTVQMAEVEGPPVMPLIRPAWSLRAANAPALGITSSAPTTPLPLPLRRKDVTLDIPGAFHTDENSQAGHQPPSATRRAYRVPVPQLDIAFAMQLRPGLGLGSDPAWLVRFLMAIFGWMTVLLGDRDTLSRSRRPALLG